MSCIIKRILQVGQGIDGFWRINPWRKTITTLGEMWEPCGSAGIEAGPGGFTDRNQIDDMLRIDEIETFNPSGWTAGEGTIGGTVLPLGNVTNE